MWSQSRPTNPRCCTAAIFGKKPLSRHISATVWLILMKFGTVTHWHLTADRPLKFCIFELGKMALAAILKITKIAMSPQRFGRSLRNLVRWCQIGLLTAPTVKKFEFQKSNMADGRHFENCQIAIALQPFDQFWWNLTRWCILVPDSGLTVKTSNF